jgi:hypothetical protein
MTAPGFNGYARVQWLCQGPMAAPGFNDCARVQWLCQGSMTVPGFSDCARIRSNYHPPPSHTHARTHAGPLLPFLFLPSQMQSPIGIAGALLRQLAEEDPNSRRSASFRFEPPQKKKEANGVQVDLPEVTRVRKCVCRCVCVYVCVCMFVFVCGLLHH